MTNEQNTGSENRRYPKRTRKTEEKPVKTRRKRIDENLEKQDSFRRDEKQGESRSNYKKSENYSANKENKRKEYSPYRNKADNVSHTGKRFENREERSSGYRKNENENLKKGNKRSFSDSDEKSYDRKKKKEDGHKPFRREDRTFESPSSERRQKSDYDKRRKSSFSQSSEVKDDKPFRRRKTEDKSEFRTRGYKREENSEKPRFNKDDRSESKFTDKKPKTDYEKPRTRGNRYDEKESKNLKFSRGKGRNTAEKELIRLNKYIANAGICSRREADKLIESGAISVNGEVITTLGFKVSPGDKVMYGDQRLNNETLRYVLLNKPKDYITTLDDPEGRKTVMNLVQNACHERIYPVGRLDRNTTGLLLLTNDGELAKKLTHPKHHIPKLYHVGLNKPLTKADFEKILMGIELEDGVAIVDEMEYASDDKKEVGVKIHLGRNRIVRRIFESLGYEVVKLDRTLFAGLTKKDLPRGKWRFLTPQEINFLKMM